ncbi:MAG: hypothetical protein KME23_28560 [Goleter apudmare HA4340-LM2]|nr:hypothetical protein [Goleter apudmare HA4340-LM2]
MMPLRAGTTWLLGRSLSWRLTQKVRLSVRTVSYLLLDIYYFCDRTIGFLTVNITDWQDRYFSHASRRKSLVLNYSSTQPHTSFQKLKVTLCL